MLDDVLQPQIRDFPNLFKRRLDLLLTRILQPHLESVQDRLLRVQPRADDERKPELCLVSRVIRAVFGNIDRRRISSYSLVLRQAQKENVPYANLPAWIEERGGIQEIRLSQSKKSAISACQKASVGKMYFQGKADLGVVQSEWLSDLVDPEHIGKGCVLLAEQQADGKFYVRAVIRNKKALNAAYLALYENQKIAYSKAEADVAAANDADGAITLQA